MRMGKFLTPFTHRSAYKMTQRKCSVRNFFKEHEFSSGVDVAHHIDSGAGEEKASRSKYKPHYQTNQNARVLGIAL